MATAKSFFFFYIDFDTYQKCICRIIGCGFKNEFCDLSVLMVYFIDPQGNIQKKHLLTMSVHNDHRPYVEHYEV